MLRKVARGIAIALASLVLLLALALWFIDTAPGRAFVVRQLNAFSTQSGMVFHVDRIDGSLYGRMRLIGFEVRDPRGAFLVAPTASLDWRPFAYARGRIDVRSLESPEVRLLRMPQLKPTPSDPNAPLLPDIDLSIGKLKVDRLVVERPITGRRHIVRIAGAADIADGRARITADADTLVAPQVAGGDRLRLRLDAVPEQNRLFLDVKLAAPVGGLVDSYAKLGKPLALSVGGSGDWASWAGRARATLAGAPLADLAVTARQGSFTVRGDARPGVALTGPAARLVEPVLALDIAGTLGERKVQFSRIAARSAAAEVQAAGLVDLGTSQFGGFRVEGRLLRPGAIADNLTGRNLAFAATLDGPMATPVVQYRLSAAALAFGTTGVEGVEASGRAVIDADRIRIPVAARVRRITGLNAAAGGLLENVAVNGDLAYSAGRLISDNLRIRSSRIDATAIVVADFGKGRYTGALKGRVNDYRIDGIGRIALQTDAELFAGPRGGFGIRGWVRANTRTLDNESVRTFLGGNAQVYADFLFDENGVASVRRLSVTAPGFRLNGGTARYDTATGRLAANLIGVSRAYGPISVVAAGTLDNLRVNLKAARPNVGVPLTDVDVELVGGSARGYQVRARGGSPYGPFSADLLVRTSPRISVDIRDGRFAGISFRGSVAATAAGPYAGAVTLAGSGLNGRVRLGAAGRYQRADFDLTAAAARIPMQPPITVGSGTIRGSAILYPAGPAVIADANLRDIRHGTLLVSGLRAKVNFTNGRGTVQMAAAGESGVPFSVQAQAALTPGRVVANLRGVVNDVAFRLAQPAIATKQGADWLLAPTLLVVPQGQVRLAGRYGAAGISGRADLDGMDLAIVEAFVPGLGVGGKVSGGITVATGGNVPTVDARLTIANLTRTAAYVVSQPVDVALLARLSDAGGEARAVVRRNGVAVGRLQARLAPFGAGASLSQRLLSAPLAGGIRYNGPAEVLWTLTGIAGQTVTGPVAVAADFGGRADRPTLTGVVRSSTLRYENQAYGTVLSNIAIDGRFTQSRLEIASLTARAGRGSVTAQGSVGLDAASGFPIDLRATLDDAQLARSDALAATVSGTVAVSNSRANGALIRGDLRIPEARYEIIRQGAAEVPELTGVRRKTTPKPRPGSATGTGTVPSNWKLDIRVRADNRIYVSGMGLEAEWATDLRVGGTATTPRVTGKLEVVRGTYSFAGRRFDLANTGEVTFDGGVLTNPQLNISATTSVEGVTATINIGGRAQNPQITFTSTPTLPQDEVLSRLLFGQSVTNLSPTQALQLAAALNSLRGSGGGLNPLGKLRSATGIDRLRILGADKTAGRGTALAAGQYISNDIYVEIITDARGFTATQLEIALSKSLSLLSSVSSFGGQSVNLKYGKDY
ncbi:translocation/assembly module TamB domain-containing protein [Sphingomonas jatrophae]|uniref:Autotransporter secretion inner membrane protein TamB n=1 Tax=Sphingomonas jatrophae TaxID=1166337 RepID=A0A1I6JPZ2_9SPHN|nr:translocation/assembly module TamB domain-containing protein [Sphingomonas jatrophae]SFR81055.1 autotransporter secretion inner membrane protein TamB [Sphingomonas jatrophae]